MAVSKRTGGARPGGRRTVRSRTSGEQARRRPLHSKQLHAKHLRAKPIHPKRVYPKRLEASGPAPAPLVGGRRGAGYQTLAGRELKRPMRAGRAGPRGARS